MGKKQSPMGDESDLEILEQESTPTLVSQCEDLLNRLDAEVATIQFTKYVNHGMRKDLRTATDLTKDCVEDVIARLGSQTDRRIELEDKVNKLKKLLTSLSPEAQKASLDATMGEVAKLRRQVDAAASLALEMNRQIAVRDEQLHAANGEVDRLKEVVNSNEGTAKDLRYQVERSAECQKQQEETINDKLEQLRATKDLQIEEATRAVSLHGQEAAKMMALVAEKDEELRVLWRKVLRHEAGCEDDAPRKRARVE